MLACGQAVTQSCRQARATACSLCIQLLTPGSKRIPSLSTSTCGFSEWPLGKQRPHLQTSSQTCNRSLEPSKQGNNPWEWHRTVLALVIKSVLAAVTGKRDYM